MRARGLSTIFCSHRSFLTQVKQQPSEKKKTRTWQRSHNVKGSSQAGTEPTFVIMHKAIIQWGEKEVWYVESGALNHMTNHDKWFFYLEKPKQSRVIKIDDDTPNPIEHIGDVPLSHVSERGIMRNDFHSPTSLNGAKTSSTSSIWMSWDRHKI
mgnify:CR=1 FL=1